MIISKTPLRISFVGGGTDHIYTEKNFGSVIVSSIDKFIYIALNNNYLKNYKISYSVKEECNNLSDIKHKIFRETLRYFRAKQGIELTSLSDVTARGSGLGSSGSFLVGLINVLSFKKKLRLSKHKIAQIAHMIETIKCKNISGKQDQYQAIYGGFNQINFLPGGNVKIIKLDVKKSILNKFQENLLIFNTGISRDSYKIYKNRREKLANVKKMVGLVEDFKKSLLSGNLDDCGSILDLGWSIKKQFEKNTSNDFIDYCYEIAKKNGAIGGKILGAGNGGFLLFYCKKENQEKLIKNLNFIKKLDFKFYYSGSKIFTI